MIEIKPLSRTDISSLEAAFAPFYAKPASIFEGYLQEEDRIIWVGRFNNKVAGYVTLRGKSHYKPFADKKILEIMDLNVIPPFRNQGIASKLLDVAETEAAKVSDLVGLGVGLYKDYGSAQRLYIQRGYVPDGNGITYNYNEIKPGSMVCLDDDLVLWMMKGLK